MSDVRIKFCGLRTVADIEAALATGVAHQLGIVLVPGVRRSVVPADAARMRAVAHDAGHRGVVGVVGGAAPQIAVESIELAGVDVVQLAGIEDEARETLQHLPPGVQVIRAIRVGDVDTALRAALEWEARGARVVFDAHDPSGALGGTGMAIALDQARRLFEVDGRGLAGGLTPTTVADAIRACAPSFVDVSSGIERDGTKSPDLMREFAAAVALTHGVLT